MGCGQRDLTHDPIPYLPPGPVVSKLAPLVGEYRLLDIDGDAVDAGRLAVVEEDSGVGIVYSISVAGQTIGREVLTPKAATEITEENGHVHQKSGSGESKTSIDYLVEAGVLTLEITECTPGMCLVSVLSAAK